jgi:hypothetical protein
MALGYEGYVKIGDKYALGTGTAVPRARTRLTSQGAYGGEINTPVDEIGLWGPRVYDWEVFDGSVDFEITKDMFSLLKAWVLDRDSQKDILFSTRKDNEQKFVDTFWNSISISATEGSLMDGSLGFVAMDRDTYSYGAQGIDSYPGNVTGKGLLCTLATGMPSPLNVSGENYNPIPSWYSKITLGVEVYDFLTWTLNFSQDVVKFFACTGVQGPQAPMYVGVGPMAVTFSGSWMWLDKDAQTSFPADDVTDLKVEVADTSISFKNLELQSISDDVQSIDSTTPVQMEYAIYELQST